MSIKDILGPFAEPYGKYNFWQKGIQVESFGDKPEVLPASKDKKD
jgi:hypothetical protein